MYKFAKLFSLLLAVICFPQTGKAEINRINFKEVSKCFKPEYLQYSPVVGKIALERGLIYNLRFFGNMTKAIAATDSARRLYAGDVGNDPLMQLLILLFPSSAGELAPVSEAISNFGKFATPEMVALLLNYAHECRNPKIAADTNTPKAKKSNKKKQDGTSSDSDTDSDAENSSSAPFKEELVSKLSSAGFHNGDAKQTRKKVNALLKTIAASIVAELVAAETHQDFLYPAFTTEQVILAFFCSKFNTKDDIWKLLERLNEVFLTPEFLVKKASNQYDNSVWKQELLVAHAIDQSDLDFVYINNHCDLISPIPYKNNTTPISNGNCPVFDRAAGTIIGSETYADCAETAIRHFANIMLFDSGTREFVLPNVALPSNESAYYKNFAEFYTAQAPASADDGSNSMRGLWNSVVGDLNYDYIKGNREFKNIRYKSQNGEAEYEIRACFGNFIKVWQKILGSVFIVDDYDATWTVEQKKQWLEESLKRLCYVLNPGLQAVEISLNVEEKACDFGTDLFGNAKFTITNQKNQEFSFSVSQMVGHAFIEGVNNVEVKKIKKIKLNNAVLPITLINSKADSHPLYQLCAKGFFTSDNVKFRVLRDLIYVEDYDVPDYLVPDYLVPVVGNVMESINVNDDSTLREYVEMFPEIINLNKKLAKFATAANLSFLEQNSALVDTSNLKSILINENSPQLEFVVPDSVLKVIVSKNVKKIICTENSRLQEIIFDSDATVDEFIAPGSLEKLRCGGTVVNLDLSRAQHLKELNFRSLKKADKIIVNSASLKEIKLPEKATIGLLDCSKTTLINMSLRRCLINMFVAPATLKTLECLGIINTLDLSQAIGLDLCKGDGIAKIANLIAPSVFKGTATEYMLYHDANITWVDPVVASAPNNQAQP